MHRISPFLWFDSQAEEAAAFYVSVFTNSRILEVTRYGNVGQEIHGRAPGSVMTVAFELDGQRFTALNGGPVFTFNESIPFVVSCDTQEEIDRYWQELLRNAAKADKVMHALLQMKKLDIAALQRAAS
jgi:predicted 3-demethylubiquinone-9 3-methyltransferase (glyoxalase superfamily)